MWMLLWTLKGRSLHSRRTTNGRRTMRVCLTWGRVLSLTLQLAYRTHLLQFNPRGVGLGIKHWLVQIVTMCTTIRMIRIWLVGCIIRRHIREIGHLLHFTTLRRLIRTRTLLICTCKGRRRHRFRKTIRGTTREIGLGRGSWSRLWFQTRRRLFLWFTRVAVSKCLPSRYLLFWQQILLPSTTAGIVWEAV